MKGRRQKNVLALLITVCIVGGVVALIGTNIYDRMQQDDAWAQGFRHGFSPVGGPVFGIWSDGEPPNASQPGYRSYLAGDGAGCAGALLFILASLVGFVLLMVQLWGPENG